MAQMPSRLQTDSHRQSANLAVGVSTDEGLLVLTQGEVCRKLAIAELPAKAWVRGPVDGGHCQG